MAPIIRPPFTEETARAKVKAAEDACCLTNFASPRCRSAVHGPRCALYRTQPDSGSAQHTPRIPKGGSPQMPLDLLYDVRLLNYSHHRVDVLAVLE